MGIGRTLKNLEKLVFVTVLVKYTYNFLREGTSLEKDDCRLGRL